MSTKISVWGTNGRITADRQECQIYLRQRQDSLPGVDEGWTVRYTTDLTEEVWYYLRGEEYSAQIDYFVQSIKQDRRDGQNSFRSALETDQIVEMILSDKEATDKIGDVTPRAASRGDRKGLIGKLFS
ncbi:hypothetical protein [Methylibium sp. T29]|nr:hypothetical protein [Methylibium sp. T29]